MSPMKSLATALISNLVHLVFPPECAWCAQSLDSQDRLCELCRGRFVSDYYRCQVCATPLPSVVPNQDCFRCRQSKCHFSQVVTLAPYRGDIRRAVIMMKRKRFELLRQAIAELLAEVLLADVRTNPGLCGDPPPKNEDPLLIPIPYHWTHGLSSAAATAECLCRAISAKTNWPIALRAVRRIRKTEKQGLLSWSERAANVHNAFSVISPQTVANKSIFLVDDVLTCGATAGELARLLKKAGAAKVIVVVAARATGAREAEPCSPHSRFVQITTAG